MPGSASYTTTSTTYPYYYVELQTEPGFYFSHDEGGTRSDGSEGGFNKGQIHDVTRYKVDYVGAEPVEVEFDESLINFGTQTPANVFDPANKTFKFEVLVYYGDEMLYQMVDGELTPVILTAYIGVKGDINFSGKADAVDASIASIYYAMLSTMNDDGDYRQPYEVILSTPDNPYITVDAPDDIYDEFAAFLGDVDTNEWAPDNWKVKKGDRSINAVDASGISVYYAWISATQADIVPTEQEAWDIAAPERFGDLKYTNATRIKFGEIKE